MVPIIYKWSHGEREHALRLVYVAGTSGDPYLFGGDASKPIEVPGFFIQTSPVTQAFWTHVMGVDANPSLNRGADLPVDNVSWDCITEPGGFRDRLNESPVRRAIPAHQAGENASFRLPTETELEYAARAGPHWRDNFPFSGSEDIDAVAWYDRKHGDHTQPVALKAPAQLGIYELSGNVWNGARTHSHGTFGIFPPTVRLSAALVRTGCFAAAVFTIGPCTAPCPSGIRSRTTHTTGASGCGWSSADGD